MKFLLSILALGFALLSGCNQLGNQPEEMVKVTYQDHELTMKKSVYDEAKTLGVKMAAQIKSGQLTEADMEKTAHEFFAKARAKGWTDHDKEQFVAVVGMTGLHEILRDAFPSFGD